MRPRGTILKMLRSLRDFTRKTEETELLPAWWETTHWKKKSISYVTFLSTLLTVLTFDYFYFSSWHGFDVVLDQQAFLMVRKSFIFFYLAKSTFYFYALNERHIAFTSRQFWQWCIVFARKPTGRLLCGIFFFKVILNLPWPILFEFTRNDLP